MLNYEANSFFCPSIRDIRKRSALMTKGSGFFIPIAFAAAATNMERIAALIQAGIDHSCNIVVAKGLDHTADIAVVTILTAVSYTHLARRAGLAVSLSPL